MWSFIFKVLKPVRFWLFLQIGLVLFWVIDANIRPYLIKLIIDRVNTHNMEIFWLGCCFILMSLLVICGMRLFQYAWVQINSPVKKIVGEMLMDKMFHLSHNLYLNQQSGALGNRIKDVMSGIPDLTQIVVDQFLTYIFLIIVSVTMFWFINPLLALGLMIWVMLFIGGSLTLYKKAHTLSVQGARVRTKTVGLIVDIITNMFNVRLFNGFKIERKNLDNVLIENVISDQKRDLYFMKLTLFERVSFHTYQCLCLFWLIYNVQKGNCLAGDFAFIIFVNAKINDQLKHLSKDISKFTELIGIISQGLEIAFTKPDIQDGKNHLIISKGDIIFENVQFGYKDSELLFQNKSIAIKGGQKLGLVGSSGGGKSSFINLILRLYDVQKGCILIDGQNIKDVTQESLREAIGMIPQDPILFHRTLMENIRYGRMEATDEEVYKAAKQAHIHDFIMQLPNGYNSFVGERGVKLSGGQRQRIAIARAFLKNAPILILDEATSQLDSVTENEIQKSLWKLMQGKTVIVIAHRLSTLLKMDRILVLDKGHIKEDGSHVKLLSKNRLYKKLWDAQVGGFLQDF